MPKSSKLAASTMSSKKKLSEVEEESDEESENSYSDDSASGPEEESNDDNYEYDVDNDQNAPSIENDSSMPLYKRLALQNSDENVTALARDRVQKRRVKDAAKEERSGTLRVGIGMRRTNKNAPAEMPSNRPVRRLRVDANNASKKTVDPRFTDVSGKLNEQIFSKNYAFLDDYRDKEIEVLSKTMKKIKSTGKKEELKTELLKMKQLSKERKRGLRVMERLENLRTEEREKVKAGKKPFFLKKAVKNTIGLEERYKELRKEGKLHKFMEKRRKKNSNKDHRWLPGRRGDSTDE